jgi:hypothetical protein
MVCSLDGMAGKLTVAVEGKDPIVLAIPQEFSCPVHLVPIVLFETASC